MANDLVTTVQGWPIYADNDNLEPHIRDIDLAERLGYSRPRDIRKIIHRMIEQKVLDITDLKWRAVVARQLAGRTGKAIREYEATEYWLTLAQSLLVCSHSKLKPAADIIRRMVSAFTHLATARLEAENNRLELLTRGIELEPKPQPSLWPDELILELCRLYRKPRWSRGGKWPYWARSVFAMIYRLALGDENWRKLKEILPESEAGNTNYMHLTAGRNRDMLIHVGVILNVATHSSDHVDFRTQVKDYFAARKPQLRMVG